MAIRGSFSPVLLVAGAVLAAGCAPSVRSERDDNIPVPQGATWAWSSEGPAAAPDTGAQRRYIPQRFADASSALRKPFACIVASMARRKRCRTMGSNDSSAYRCGM